MLAVRVTRLLIIWQRNKFLGLRTGHQRRFDNGQKMTSRFQAEVPASFICDIRLELSVITGRSRRVLLMTFASPTLHKGFSSQCRLGQLVGLI